MRAVGALLELRVDVERHLRVGVADLAHDPLDVEAVGDEGDGDVGAAEGVGRRVRERRPLLFGELLVRSGGRLLEDLGDALAGHPAAAKVRERVVVRAGAIAGGAQAREVRGEALDEVRRHLHLADARLGLRVGDAEARAVGVVQPDVLEPEVAQFAHTHAATAEHLDTARRPA
ncbi:MAG TPA: hypothetical protein VF533_25630 [Solirubrobacteraceae bacterium]